MFVIVGNYCNEELNPCSPGTCVQGSTCTPLSITDYLTLLKTNATATRYHCSDCPAGYTDEQGHKCNGINSVFKYYTILAQSCNVLCSNALHYINTTFHRYINENILITFFFYQYISLDTIYRQTARLFRK